MRYRVTVKLPVIVQVNDPDAIARGSDPEWAAAMYGKMDSDRILNHLAYNCVLNGVGDVSRLDGWADLSKEAVTMTVDVPAGYEPEVEVLD